MKKITSLLLAGLMLLSVFGIASASAADEIPLYGVSVNYICAPEDGASAVDYILFNDFDGYKIECIKWYALTSTGGEYPIYNDDTFTEGDSYRVEVSLNIFDNYTVVLDGLRATINGEECSYTHPRYDSVILSREFTATAAKEHTYGEWVRKSEAGIGSDGVTYRVDNEDRDYFEVKVVPGFYGDFELLDTDRSDDAFYYTGKVITPMVTIRDGGENTLKKGTDYTLSYSSGRKNVGTYKITVKFINKISGSQTFTFRIIKAPNPMKVGKATKSVKYSTVKKKNVVVAPISVRNAQGKKSFKKLSGSNKIVVNKTNGKFTVKKGTKKGTYKVKVQVKAAGNSSYQGKAQIVTAVVKVK